MTVISRRILVPMVGKSELALARAKQLAGILARLGAPTRACRVVAGKDAGSLEILSRFENFASATSLNVALSKDGEMKELEKAREQGPSATFSGPYLYRSVFGEVPMMPAIVQREYQVSRQNLPELLKLLPEAFEAVARKPMFAVVPVFAPEMDRLFISYYAEDLEAMGRNLDQYGVSDAFQAAVQKASRFGQVVSARAVLVV